ncbi:unnamed protein product [Lactuca saligna]|uniref:Poly [ADP-ribose] polymerase n=1 Tax=Lactuca saligna TaxID=75948 RepID=A0AA35YFI1_LACSI|nr:unnamed protein product [Lactuca saligna]
MPATDFPSVHPHVIKDEDAFKLKVKMLEALQDNEIASGLVGFDVDIDDSLHDKYKKLQCEMVPLPHDSEDYQLVEKYLQTTHAPTQTDWALELEEVFTVEIQGEFDKFVPYKNKFKNKILLRQMSSAAGKAPAPVLPKGNQGNGCLPWANRDIKCTCYKHNIQGDVPNAESLAAALVRKVDPTLDMEADEGDNYTHIQVRNRVG